MKKNETSSFVAGKRILMIAPQPFFQWRGSPIRIYFNIIALTELGFRVDLLTLPIGENVDVPGAQIHRISNPLRIPNIPIGPSLTKALFDLILLFKGLRMGRRRRYAVVHGIEDAGIIALIIGRALGSAVVFEKHSDPASYKNGMLRNVILCIYRGIEKLTIRGADVVIGTGKGLVEQVKQMHNKAVVHHIFDLPSSQAVASQQESALIRKRCKASKEDIVITYVGSFASYQGIDLIFKAIPKVVGRHSNAKFIIVGGNEAEIAQRKQWLQGQGIKNAVTFLGRIDPNDIPHVLHASDILLSSRITGVNTPLKVLDYLKSGRPIIATDVPANRFILNEQTAEFVAPESDDLASGITRLINNSQQRSQLGERGFALFQEKFSFDEFKRRLQCCYEQIFDSRAGRFVGVGMMLITLYGFEPLVFFKFVRFLS